jgi:hypothetical protein
MILFFNFPFYFPWLTIGELSGLILVTKPFLSTMDTKEKKIFICHPFDFFLQNSIVHIIIIYFF